MAKLERCLVGGTFDRFHQGHKSLLNAALDSAELVEVWITNDAMSAANLLFYNPLKIEERLLSHGQMKESQHMN